MKGQILNIEENKGIILGEDGNRYEFDINEWKEKITPIKGMKVDFEIEDNKAKNIYLLETPKPDLITALNMESNIKTFGGFGAICLLLSWIPYIGLALYILGLIFLTIAFKKLAEKGKKEILKNWLITILISIGGGIIIALLAYSALANSSDILVFLVYLTFVIAAIIEGILYKKIFLDVYEITKEPLFKTTANTFFWGGILSFILIGGILFFIGWIIAAIAFFSIKTQKGE